MENNEKIELDEFIGKYEAITPINSVDLKNQFKNGNNNFNIQN